MRRTSIDRAAELLNRHQISFKVEFDGPSGYALVRENGQRLTTMAQVLELIRQRHPKPSPR